MTPSTMDLLTQWSWQPTVLIGLALFTWGYGFLARRTRAGGSPGPLLARNQVVLFVAASLTLVLALLSPIDYIGDQYLFSMHMVQHLLLASVWPPLLLLATPAWMLRPLLQRRVVTAILGFLTYPATAIMAFTLDLYLWHIPALYDLTLQNEYIHVLEHLSFMFFGILNWWPVLSPLREQRLAYAFQVLYLFVDAMLMMAPAILFTFAPMPFYPPYVAAPRLWGISALSDQQVGGLIMWYPGNVPYVIGIISAFYKWFDTGNAAPTTPRSNVVPPSASEG